MILKSLNIQSVAIKSTKVAIIGAPKEGNGLIRTKPIETNLVTAIAREHDHTKFHVTVCNKVYDVICPGYIPEIIFSSLVNDYWEYPKPDTTTTHDTVDDLDIYWDYLYDGMEIKGVIKDDTFVINIPHLKKATKQFFDKYKYRQLKEAKLKNRSK